VGESTPGRNWGEPEDIPWPQLGREELVDAYWEVVAPELSADGADPETDRPTYGWLRNAGSGR